MSQSNMGRRCVVAGALFLAGALSVVAQPARAQTAKLDARWQGWLGCWAPVAAPAQNTDDSTAAQVVCVAPATGTTGVDISTVANGKIVAHEQLVATGKQIPASGSGCEGWQSSQWAADGHHIYLHSEYDCSGGAGGLMRKSNGVLAITPSGEWLDVRGVAVGEGTAVHVLRYRPVPTPSTLPTELASSLQDRTLSDQAARTAAAAPLTTADVMDASKHLDAPVLQAWLVAQHQGFDVDAKQLVTLADAGVPSTVIDALVALSYPDAFEINPGARQGQLAAAEDEQDAYGSRAGARHVVVLDPYGYSPFGYSPFGYSPFGYSPFGYSSFGSLYGMGFGWYGGSSPVIIVRQSDMQNAQPERSHGTMVKGRGYVPAAGSGSTGRHATPRGQVHVPSTRSSGTVRSTPTARPTTTRTATPRRATPRHPNGGNGNG